MIGNQKFLKALGENINKLRKEKGLSFLELALESDIEKANLVKLTSKGTNITVTTLHNISKGLGVTASELMDFPFEDLN